MKVKAFYNLDVGTKEWKDSQRECEIQIVPCETMLAHGTLVQAKCSVVKMMRRGVWLYNASPRVPNWHKANGIQYGIVLSYGQSKAEQNQAGWHRAIEKSMAHALAYGSGAIKVAQQGEIGEVDNVRLVTYGKAEVWDEYSTFDPKDFIDLKREPWRKR